MRTAYGGELRPGPRIECAARISPSTQLRVHVDCFRLGTSAMYKEPVIRRRYESRQIELQNTRATAWLPKTGFRLVARSVSTVNILSRNWPGGFPDIWSRA